MNKYRPILQKLVKCLQEASDCIEQVPENEFKTVSVQLESLKLILDGNVYALRVWMDDSGFQLRNSLRTNAASS